MMFFTMREAVGNLYGRHEGERGGGGGRFIATNILIMKSSCSLIFYSPRLASWEEITPLREILRRNRMRWVGLGWTVGRSVRNVSVFV